MPVGLGQDVYIGFATESVAWGTAVARTKFLKVNSESIKEEEGLDAVQPLYSRYIDENDSYQTGRKASGSFEFINRWEGAEVLFLHAFGSVATTTPDSTNAPTARQHVFTLADAPPNYGLTLEVARSIKSLVVPGCKIKSLRFSMGLRGPLVISVDVVGKGGTGYSAATTPSFTTTKVISFKDVKASTWIYYGGAQLKISAFDITINNPFEEDRATQDSRDIAEPVFNGKVAVSGSFVTEWTSESAQRADFAAATSKALVATFEGATLGGAILQKLQIDCPAIKLVDFDNSAQNMGIMRERIAFRAFRTTALKEITLTLVNTVASVA